MTINSAKPRAWALAAALAGGVLAVLLTPLFVVAYYASFAQKEVPPIWVPPVRGLLAPLLTADPAGLYTNLGRLFDWVYLLILLGALELGRLHRSASRLATWGMWVLGAGLVVSFVGVAADYWADGAIFAVQLLGLVALLIGATMLGVAALRGKWLPTASAWLLALSGLGGIAGLIVIQHIPSGPTFFFGLAWIVIGLQLLRQPPAPTHRHRR